ncbi:vesicle-associated protein 4-2 [Selaginella moellendorffii]|nr:vesicle-associated protein 4-2 [Selaginella moellendorffii]XP_024545494.1 vesicle-associated protein 4-2 [Selaginella moellendorffii]|eukprot:XP_002984631.2 vesicle-associated protein 4-2 [Selaginella moellendorffii]
MAAVENGGDGRLHSAVFGGCAPCRLPWRSRVPADHSGSVLQHLRHQQDCSTSSDFPSSRSVSAVAKVFSVQRSRLKFESGKNLIFLYEPGKQVASAVKIKNVSRSPVAFKFQTTAPKSCFMCPPNGVIMPNETIVAKVVKYVEVPEGPQQQPRKLKDKFRIVSLKVKEGVEYTPELFDEQKDLVAVERVLRVVFLDPQTASPAELEKQQKRLAEADAAQEARKKPQNDRSHKGGAVQGFVIDEWKERREKYLAKQQAEAQDSY